MGNRRRIEDSLDQSDGDLKRDVGKIQKAGGDRVFLMHEIGPV